MAKPLADIINAVRQLANVKLEDLAKDLESTVAVTNHVEELKSQRGALLAETLAHQVKLDGIKAAVATESKNLATLKEAQILVRDETRTLKGHLADLKAKVAAIL